uniref:Uncharacterized protein n=1 Tax=Phenylobacterium glaciei TaxID=2803784 RepID=A0A974S7E7_9CAUL|nr:hypothetical protein JKL49_23435 [Phenylobacterium glaciei]
MLTAFSQLASGRLARRIGLVNTMVFTHIPANICLMLVAFAPACPSPSACCWCAPPSRPWMCRRARPTSWPSSPRPSARRPPA